MADAVEKKTYVMLRRGLFRHNGTTYGRGTEAGTEVTTATDLPKLYPGLFVVKGEEGQSPAPPVESIGEDATAEIGEDIRKLAGIHRIVKLGATFIAMGEGDKVLATGSLSDIEKALV